MNRICRSKIILTGLTLGLALQSQSLFACAACFGKSDSQLAVGMNWGIFTLLGVVGCVLSGFLAFGFYLVKKSAAVAAATAQEDAPDSTPKI